MNAHEIHAVRAEIERDPVYTANRAALHADYGWLESYWSAQDGEFNGFVRQFSDFYWAGPELRELGKALVSLECVGNSRDSDYLQTEEVAKATMHLRHHADLSWSGAPPNCESVGCRTWKVETGRCRADVGTQWPERAHSAFKAVMEIVRQVRNNLFHGQKGEIECEQLARNRELVRIGAEIVKIVWKSLPDAEENPYGG